MKKITTQDIADRLHISRNTVSRALNNQIGVGADTRQTIIDEATKMGYEFPDEATEAHETASITPAVQRTIALIATDFTLELKSFFGIILNRLKHDLRKEHVQLDVFAVTSQMRDHLTLPEPLSTKHYDGLIIMSFISAPYIHQLLDLKLPTVLIDHHDPSLQADSVLTENIDGTKVAINYLAEHGYQTFGFVGETSFSPSYQERYLGFMNAIESSRQLTAKPEHIITQIEEAYPNKLFEQLNAIKHMPEVWFSVNNGYASMLVTYLQGKGYRVPEDIGVMSFDDTDITQIVTPKLTVIATSLAAMADTAWRRLKQRMNPDAPSQQLYIRLMPEIIERDSITTIHHS
jgi:LacI family transcriptional regulator